MCKPPPITIRFRPDRGEQPSTKRFQFVKLERGNAVRRVPREMEKACLRALDAGPEDSVALTRDQTNHTAAL